MSIRPVPPGTPSRVGRTRFALTAVTVTLCALGVAACGTGREHVGVGRATDRPTTHHRTAQSPGTTLRPSVVGAVPDCSAQRLSVDQAPLSAGTGISTSAWSITNGGPSACGVPAGQPGLAFVDAAGNAVTHYSVTHLPGPPGSAVRLAPGGRAWFVTEESTTSCGVGTVVSGGPFRYEVSLPGTVGTSVWAPSYLAGASLSDFCADVALRIGDLQPTRPTAP